MYPSRLPSCRWQVVLVCLLIIPANLGAQEEAKVKRPLIPIVVLKRGETREIQLGWDDGTGRAAAFFVGNEAKLSKAMLDKGINGSPRWEQDGLTVEYDEKTSNALAEAFHKDGRFKGYPQGKPNLSFTPCSYRVTAAKNAKPRSFGIYVHVVSGTGRNMQLEGEFRVLVQE